MSFLDQLRILRVPGAVKIFLGVIAFSLIALNVYVIARGLVDQRYDFWVAAGASLLAAAAPALAVFTVLAVTESGMDALKRRMQQMLAQEIPEELTFAFEAPPPKFLPPRDPRELTYRPNRADVACGMYRDELWADYQLCGKTASGEEQVARMRIELVLRRVNINMVFERSDAAKLFGVSADAGADAFGEAFRRAFKHTIDGATGAGYHFNPAPIERRAQRGCDLAFVATRAIDPEFAWDPAARLEFIQDLALMVRAFINEQPNVFRRAEVVSA